MNRDLQAVLLVFVIGVEVAILTSLFGMVVLGARIILGTPV